MCRSREEGGYRCPSHSSPRARAGHNARRRVNRAVRAAAAEWAREHLSEEAASQIAAASPGATRELATELGVPSHIVHPAAVTHPQPPVQRIALAPLTDYGFKPASALRANPDDLELDEESFQSELWASALSEDEYEAIQDYTANDYDVINAALKRGTAEDLPEQYQELISNIDSALDKASRPGEPRTVYRGARVPKEWSPSEVGDHIAKAFPIGTSITYPTYLSTSLKPSVAESFARGELPVVYEMRSRSGVDLEALSDMPGEHEILIGRDTRWRVAGVTTSATTVKATWDGFEQTPAVVIHLVEEDLAVGESAGDAPGLAPLRKTFNLPT